MLCLPVCCLQALLLKSRHSASTSLLSNTSGDGASVWYTLMPVHIHGTTPPRKKNLSVVCVTNSVLMHFLLGVCYLFSSAWFLLAIHYSCFLHTHTTCFFLAFRLFLMLSFYFPPASLLCLLWAALWCHVASPAQLSGPGELGIILSFLITVLDTLNSVELNFFMWNMLHRNSQLIPYIEDLDISNQIWVESNKHLIKKKVCLSYFQPFLKTIDTLLTFWLIRIDMYTEL